MMTLKSFTALALFLIFGTGTTTAQERTVRLNDLEQRENVWYLKGQDTPYTGKVGVPGEMEGLIEDGLARGQWQGWYENGDRQWITDYDEAGHQTYRAWWYPYGEKRYEVRYREGRPHGVMARWYPSGVKQSETTYANGQQHGKRQMWDLEGNLLLETTYREGMRHGPSIWWYANGQKRWETHFADDQRTGLWTQYSHDGETFMQSRWEAGTLVSRTNPHKDH